MKLITTIWGRTRSCPSKKCSNPVLTDPRPDYVTLFPLLGVFGQSPTKNHHLPIRKTTDHTLAAELLDGTILFLSLAAGLSPSLSSQPLWWRSTEVLRRRESINNGVIVCLQEPHYNVCRLFWFLSFVCPLLVPSNCVVSTNNFTCSHLLNLSTQQNSWTMWFSRPQFHSS